MNTPAVQTAAVVWELLLGGWLLSSLVAPASGRGSPLPWLLAVVTFAAFALVSGYLGIIGQANCGCFGVIQASPWAAFGVDLAILALLLLGRPTRTNWSGSVGGLKWLGGVGVVMLGLVGMGALAFGSLDAAVANRRGGGRAECG